MDKVKAFVDLDVIEKIVKGRPDSYITGSFIVGGATPASDIDIVIPIDCPVDIRVLEKETKRRAGHIEYSTYNNGRKIHIPGFTTLNILHLHPLDYAAFLFATDTMRRNTVITDRNARHRCFEELCHTYKSFINPTCVTIDRMHKVIDRNLDAEFMASMINWEDFYAR